MNWHSYSALMNVSRMMFLIKNIICWSPYATVYVAGRENGSWKVTANFTPLLIPIKRGHKFWTIVYRMNIFYYMIFTRKVGTSRTIFCWLRFCWKSSSTLSKKKASVYFDFFSFMTFIRKMLRMYFIVES